MASICLTELSKNIETFDKNIDKLTCELGRDIKCKGCGAKGLNLVRLNGRCDYCISNGIVEKNLESEFYQYLDECNYVEDIMNNIENELLQEAAAKKELEEINAKKKWYVPEKASEFISSFIDSYFSVHGFLDKIGNSKIREKAIADWEESKVEFLSITKLTDEEEEFLKSFSQMDLIDTINILKG